MQACGGGKVPLLPSLGRQTLSQARYHAISCCAPVRLGLASKRDTQSGVGGYGPFPQTEKRHPGGRSLSTGKVDWESFWLASRCFGKVPLAVERSQCGGDPAPRPARERKPERQPGSLPSSVCGKKASVAILTPETWWTGWHSWPGLSWMPRSWMSRLWMLPPAWIDGDRWRIAQRRGVFRGPVAAKFVI